MSTLPSVRSGLLRHSVKDQVLVYDTRDDRVHLLDSTTAFVLDLLEKKGSTRQSVIAELASGVNAGSADELLTLSLDELRTAGLLDGDAEPDSELPEVTRRNMLGKLAAAGIAAVLVPAIATLTADKAYAATCTELNVRCGRTQDAPCCPGLCCDLNAHSGSDITCKPNGSCVP